MWGGWFWLQIAGGGVHDARPLGVGAADNSRLVFEVLLKDRGIHEKIEFAIDDIRKAHVPVEFLIDENTEGAEAPKLR